MTTDTQQPQTFVEDIERVHDILNDRERDYPIRRDEVVEALGILARRGSLEAFRVELRNIRHDEIADGVAHWADLGVIVDAQVAEQSAPEER